MHYICSDVFGQKYTITASHGASSAMLQHNDLELTQQFISRLSIEPSRWPSIVSMIGVSLVENNRSQNNRSQTSHCPQAIYQAVSQLVMSGRLCIHRQATIGASSAIRITNQGSHVDKGLCLARGPNTNEPSTHNLVPIKDRAAAEQLLQGVDGGALSAGLHHNDLSEFATESHQKGSGQKESVINALVAGDILAYLVDMPSAAPKAESEGADISSTTLAGVKPVSSGSESSAPAPSETASSQTDAAANDDSAVSQTEPASVSDDATTGAASADDTCTRGCPISMVSGEELLTLNDFTLPGPLPFTWKRTYRTGHNRDMGLGHGWTHAGCERLYEDNEQVKLHDDEGRILSFKRPQLQQRSTLVNEQMAIDATDAATYIVRKHGQPHKVFTRVGQTRDFRLTQIQHPAYTAPTGNRSAQNSSSQEQGFTLTFQYNAQNALVAIEGNWGKTLQVDRNIRGQITGVALQDKATNSRFVVAAYDYSDENDLILQRDSAGRGEAYAYNNHLFVQRTLATGFSYYYEWDSQEPGARCVHTWGDNGVYDYRFEWDTANNRTLATDSRGFTTEFIYNEFGLITQETDNEGGVNHYTYENGLRTSHTDPAGNTTHYGYDSANRLVSVTDAIGQSQEHRYVENQLVSSTDKSGAQWRRTYNTSGLLASLTSPDGQTTQYRYNAQGLLVQQEQANKQITRYEWNATGELTALISPEGHKQEFAYNALGQRVKMDVWLASRAHGGTTRYVYNASNELVRITYPNGEKVDIAYNANGQVERMSDRRNRVTQYQYDGLSQVIHRTDPEGNSLAYAYDTERNLIRLTNENGEHYHFTYDGNERLTKEIGFDGRTQHYKYNAAGHLIKHMDAGEVVTDFERDPLGRMLSKFSRAVTDTDGKASERNRYSYDPAGRLTETYNSDQYLAFTYDRMGYLIKEHHSELNEQKQRINSSMVDIHYQRAATGQLKQIQLPDAQTIDYGYDSANRLEQVLFNNNAITHIERDDLGMEVNRQQGEVITHSNYDPMGRLTQQHTQNKQHKTDLIQREYQYDDAGNLSVFKDGIDASNSWEVRYVYDMVDRLKHTEGNLNENFVFDPAGNLLGQQQSQQNETSEQPTETGKNAKGNRLSFQGDRKFTYDARGNLIHEARGKGGKLTTVFTYNLNNQLISVTKNNQTTTYTYDPLGRRVSKQDNFGSTNYLWAGDQLAQEHRNNIKKTYVYEPESFRPVAMVQDDEIYHYHLDHLGTPRELTNTQGKIVWKAHYKTYGNVALKDVEDVENNIRFQGQYFDEETGLHYNRHRYYDPSVGQFTTQDPIGLLGGVNGYQYAPNPVGWVDPFGLMCEEGSNEIPENYNIIEDRFENAIFNLDPGDPTVTSSVEKLAIARNVPVIDASNIHKLKDVKILTFVCHGSGDSFVVGGKTMCGTTLGDRLNEWGFAPNGIEAVACQRELGPARQELADATGVPVLGGLGRMAVQSNGEVVIFNEDATKAKGDPDDRNNWVLHPQGKGKHIYRPKA